MRRWGAGTICPIRPRKRRADPWWHRCYLARVSECRSELSSQSDRTDPYRREHSCEPSRDERAHTCRSAWGCKERPGRTYPSLLHSAFRLEFQDHSARCLLGQHRPQQYQGERRVIERPSRGGSYYRQRFLCSTYQEESQQMSELITFNQLI